MERQSRSVSLPCTRMYNFPTNSDLGIVGPPAHHLLGVEGVEGAQGPRFRKLSPQEIEDYLTNL
jgi:hypothetical protein